jgi:uridine phosphorylase
LVNIDLETRNADYFIIRIGTSGSLQTDIPVDSFVMSKFGLDNMLRSLIDEVSNLEMEDAFVKHTNWDVQRKTYVIACSEN